MIFSFYRCLLNLSVSRFTLNQLLSLVFAQCYYAQSEEGGYSHGLIILPALQTLNLVGYLNESSLHEESNDKILTLTLRVPRHQTSSTALHGVLSVPCSPSAPWKAVDLGHFSLRRTTYSRLGMLNESSLQEEYEYVIFILIQCCTDISVFGTERVTSDDRIRQRRQRSQQVPCGHWLAPVRD